MPKIRRITKRLKSVCDEVLSDDEIEIHSNSLALISGCRRLTEYTKHKITLTMKDMTVTISGEDLEPESLINGRMAVRGFICEVKYECD